MLARLEGAPDPVAGGLDQHVQAKVRCPGRPQNYRFLRLGTEGYRRVQTALPRRRHELGAAATVLPHDLAGPLADLGKVLAGLSRQQESTRNPRTDAFFGHYGRPVDAPLKM